MFTNPICHWSSVVPLYDFNPGARGPVEQPFPLTTPAMTALGLPAPVTIYGINEAPAAGTIHDLVGAADLTPAGVGAPLQGQKAVGLYDGTSLSNKRAVEFEYIATSKANAANATVHDFDATTSFCFFFIFRSFRQSPGNLSLWGKQVVWNSNGYRCHLTMTSLTWLVDGGAQIQSERIEPFYGGHWHYGLCWVNRTTDQMQVMTDLGNGALQSTAGYASLSNAEIFTIGDGIYNSSGHQMAYMCLWTGANAEDVAANWTGTYADLLWRHGRDPTGVLTFLWHNSQLSTVCGRDADGLLLGDWCTRIAQPRGQFPWAWEDGFSHAGKLGVAVNDSHTSLVNYSDTYVPASTWVVVNAQILLHWVNDADDGPNGFHTAQRLQATAANGYIRHPIACAALTEYTFDVILRRHFSGGNVDGALIAWDNTAGVQIAIQTFTAIATWERIALTFTTPVGCANMDFRIRIDTNGESLSLSRSTAVAGPLVVPIYKHGAVGGIASANDMRTVAGAGDLIKGPQGEIAIHYICFADDAPVIRNLFDTTPNADRRGVEVQANENPAGRLYNNVGALISTDTSVVVDQSLEHTIRYRWNNSVLLPCGRYSEVILDGVSYPGYNLVWVANSAVTTLYISESSATALQLDGVIDYVKVYEFPQPP